LGKYGAPNEAKVWEHFVINCNKGRLPDETTAGPNAATGTKSQALPKKLTEAELVKHKQTVNNCKSRYYAFGATNRLVHPNPNTNRKRRELKFQLQNINGDNESCNISLLDNALNREMWNFADDREPSTLKRVLQTSDEYAPFPILMPTCGRPHKAKLDLSAMMKNKKHVHIVCLKRSQLKDYSDAWLDHTFFILPDTAEDLGIGAARWWISKLAKTICKDLLCRLIYMGDDSVYGFGGLTLPGDPCTF
jgi:hypothetical protein